MQEDGDGNGVFEIDDVGHNILEIATANSEPSGIVDVSDKVGYAAGSVFLTSVQGSGSLGAQLAVLISPTAAIDTSLDGDFDDLGNYTCSDVDSLVWEILAGTHAPEYDLNRDGLVNQVDLQTWLAEAGAMQLATGGSYLPGDANLDGAVDGTDFSAWNAHKFQVSSGWCAGDFNADGLVDGSDFSLWNRHKFTTSDVVSHVPEPLAAIWVVSAVAFFGIRQVFARRAR